MAQKITHKNHYVPEFYLRNWSIDGNTIQTYRILVSHSKVPYWEPRPISSSAKWDDFYTRVESGKEIDDFEKQFNQQFETPATPVINKLLKEEKISYEEKLILSRFLFAQFVRTPAHYVREMELAEELFPSIIKETASKLPEMIKKKRIPRVSSPTSKINSNLFPLKVTLDTEKEGFKVDSIIGRGLYLHSLEHQLSSTLKVAEKHDWRIIHAANSISFPTSDDPVICLNFNSATNYNFDGGWNKKNCCIFMPLSPRLLIFTQIGKKGPYSSLDYSEKYSQLFHDMIIQHAYRYVYSLNQQKGMLRLNPRIIDKDKFEQEKEIMANWHMQQIQMEKTLFQA